MTIGGSCLLRELCLGFVSLYSIKLLNCDSWRSYMHGICTEYVSVCTYVMTCTIRVCRTASWRDY